MKSLVKAIVMLLLFTLSNSILHGEEIMKLKYGKVTKEELLMNKYELDTAAEAVVLYEYAEFVPERFMFIQHIRIKVLKKTATDIASMVFHGRLKSFVKGTTYNLENGEIVKSKLKAESIFEERVVADIYRTRIAMPNVKEGSVFEIEIMQESVPYSFEIQRNIPVIYGAIVFPDHEYGNFRIKEIGYLGYSFKGDKIWIVKDMPAFKAEPYMISENDNRVRMEFELISYQIAANNKLYSGFFASSWDAVVKKFNDNEYFGGRIADFSEYLNNIADSIKTKSKTDEEKAKNAFNAIKKIHWNNYESCYPSQALNLSYKHKEGNSADINLNLLLLLKKLNIKCYPVLFSTRSNGKITKFSPTINKINYVIVAVDLPSGKVYLDATNEFLPYGLIPDKLSGCIGLPLDNSNKADCSVFLVPTQKDKKVIFSNLAVDSTGNIKGKITSRRQEYNNVNFREYLKGKSDHDTYIQEVEANNSGWAINNYTFTNLQDTDLDFVSEYEVSYGSTLGASDLFIFNPLAFAKISDNPFQNEKRFLPISFTELKDYSTTVTISLPKNYKVSEIPKSIDVSNNDKSVRFTYTIQNFDNSISIKTKFTINKLNFETFEYNSLRGLYEAMLKKLDESIILKKI